MTEQVVSLERLQECLEREPAAGAMRLLAETYYQQGLYPQAAAASRRALSLYPENPEIRLILGQSLVSLGEFSEAEEVFLPLVREIGRLGEVFKALEQLYGGQGRSGEAAQAGELYRLLQEGLGRLLEGGIASPADAERRRSLAARTLEELEKWQGALQAR